MEEIRAMIGIKSRGGRLGEIGNLLKDRPEVICAYEVTGDFDIVFMGTFKGMMGLEKFVKAVLQWKYVERTTTFVSINTIKECHKVQ
ncbi:MAG: Lrp/AsnC family transcriptional regulator [Candidatus Altiarchaeota archaeon]|nr:Lrp/AsnC family transcriptional regulator [Candidatus Altiarchaeota archaeon]